MKKILLSAYACEPNKGSEPGVGWEWSIQLSKRGYDVHVITRTNNRPIINEYLRSSLELENLSFHYVDLPRWFSWWKRGGFGVHAYYFIWQIFAFVLAVRLHQKYVFSLVHHVTFVTVRQPSFMGLLGIPFIFGPIGGGDSFSFRCRTLLDPKDWINELLRDLLNFLVKYDPFMLLTFWTSSHIYATSQQTLDLIPKYFHFKSSLQLAIYPNVNSKLEGLSPAVDLLYVGRFIYLKGLIHLIEAIRIIKKTRPNISLTLVGDGPLQPRISSLIYRYNLQNNITIVSWVSKDDLSKYYFNHKVFVFPSMRDSGGMVVFEALSHSLPVICLNKGGPSYILRDGGGILINADDDNQIIRDLSVSILKLLNDPTLLAELQGECSKVVDNFSFDKRFSLFKLYHS